MIEFGKTLRAAREAKGLSVAQLAEQTHMTPARIEELENENFTSFPAAIYGRGFVRLYCQAVGLDPKPLADEFTEIFNGNRVVEIKEREVGGERGGEVGGERSRWSEDSRLPLSAPETETDTPRSTSNSEVGGVSSSPSMDVNTPRSTSTFSTSNSEAEAALPRSPSTPSPSDSPSPHLSRYAAPVHDRPRISIPPAVWRIGILACVALLVLWGLIAGVRALYRATGGAPAPDEQPTALDEPARTEAPTPKTPSSDAEPRAPEAKAPSSAATEPRTPQDIPALYID